MKSKLEIKYGLIIGIGVSLWVLLEFVLGFHGNNIQVGQYSGYFAAIIPIIALWIAVGEKRDQELGGNIRIMQGVKMSALISLLAGIILAVFMVGYITVINPGFIQTATEFQVSKLQEQGYTQAEIEEVVLVSIGFMTAPVQAAAAFFGTLIQGTFIGFIITLIRRRKNYATKVQGGSGPQPPANPPTSRV